MRLLRGFIILVLAVAVVSAGFLTMRRLVESRPKVEAVERPERAWPVRAATIAIADIQPELRLFGEIVAGRSVELRALVAGEILKVGENFVDGGAVRAGEMMVTIDGFDYQIALEERQAQLAEAEARVGELIARQKSLRDALKRDREIVALLRRNLKRAQDLKQRGSGTDRALDTARLDLTRQLQTMSNRENELNAERARLEQQKALIRRLRVGVRRLERDLTRTELKAPFDGYLFDIAAEVGKRLSLNDRVARLIDAGRLEARLHLSNSQFGRLTGDGESLIGRPADVHWRIGGREESAKAMIDRVAPTIDAASGGVNVFARLAGGALAQPIRPGAFVTVTLADRKFVNVVRLPESALFDDDTVYAIVDNRAQPRQVTLVARQGNDVLLRGDLRNGERVIASRFAEIGPGVLVEARTE